MCVKHSFQLTLAIIKPHVIKQPYALQDIKDKILKANFKIVRSKQLHLKLKDAEMFYKEHQGKFFFNRLITLMISGPSEFYIMGKMNAIKDWRALMGPTKVLKAQYSDPESIRGLYGLSDTRNATHGSDSVESAHREIVQFFPEFNIENWYRNEEAQFRAERIKLNYENFVHIPV